LSGEVLMGERSADAEEKRRRLAKRSFMRRTQ
jgi:hypothetical protein